MTESNVPQGLSTMHTPGPWQACKEGACTCGQVWSLSGDMPVFYALEDGKRQIVGLACNEWGDAPDLIYGAVGREQQVANARLIAAAPDMLAMLRRLSGEFAVPAFEVAALIAKAEGRS